IEINPDSAEIYNNRGSAFQEKERDDRAIQDFNEAIRLDPENPIAYYNRGNIYEKKDGHDLAIGDYDKAIEINPYYANAYSNRGNAYSEKGEYDRAIKDYNKAIEINPSLVEAYVNRALVMAQNEAREGAEEYKKRHEVRLEEEITKSEKQLKEMLEHKIQETAKESGEQYNKLLEKTLASETKAATELYGKQLKEELDNRTQKTIEQFQEQYEKQMKEELDSRTQKTIEQFKERYDKQLEVALAATAGTDVATQYQDRADSYSDLVEDLDGGIKQFAYGTAMLICFVVGALLWTVDKFVGQLSGTGWIVIPLLSLMLVLISYPLLSQLRHMRENRNRLEVCREDYVRKGILAQYTRIALMNSDNQGRQKATSAIQKHLADKSSAEFLSDWGKSTKGDDSKIPWKNIIKNNPASQITKDD
ncbi:MAG: tetratricopeptide repeat protein, partial [Alphaproteobacteria bacterium]